MRVLICCILFIYLPRAYSQEEQKQDPRLVDSTHSRLSNRITWLADSVDNFFGNRRADDEKNTSTVRVFTTYNRFEQRSEVIEYNIRANIRLPGLEQKLKDSFKKSHSAINNVLTAPFNNNPDVVNEKKRNHVKEWDEITKDWDFGTDVSARLSSPAQLLISSRARRNIEDGPWIYRFLEQVSWFSKDKFQEETRLDFDYALNEKHLFRFTNSKIWRQIDTNIYFAHGPIIFSTLTPKDAVSYSLISNSTLEEELRLVAINLSLTYRRLLYKNWLFFEITPALNYMREYNFKKKHSLFVRLEGVFGNI